jgi:chemotaxis protein CheX
MIGDPIAQLDADCIDAVGEIANMISGNAKTDFPGGTSAISVPRVVVGKDKLTYSAAAPIISIPCETEKGPLHIDVGLASAAR